MQTVAKSREWTLRISGVISIWSKIHHEANALTDWAMISLNSWLYKYDIIRMRSFTKFGTKVPCQMYSLFEEGIRREIPLGSDQVILWKPRFWTSNNWQRNTASFTFSIGPGLRPGRHSKITQLEHWVTVLPSISLSASSQVF